MANSSTPDDMDIDSEDSPQPRQPTGKLAASRPLSLCIQTRNSKPVPATVFSTASTSDDTISVRPRPNQRLYIEDTLINDLRHELYLLKCPKKTSDCDTEGYHEFSSQQLADFCQENWGCWLVEWLPESMQPKMTPRTPPAWIIQDLKKRGESLARYKAKIQKQKKSVLDWDIRLLAHLGLLSDFTPGQGDMVLRLLTEATELRLKQSKANVKAHELTYLDVRKVIDGAIHKANETPVEFGRRHLEMFRRESQGEDNESQEEDSESQEEDSESPEDDDEYLP